MSTALWKSDFFFLTIFIRKKCYVLAQPTCKVLTFRSPSGKHLYNCTLPKRGSVPSGNPYAPALEGHRDACTNRAATCVSNSYRCLAKIRKKRNGLIRSVNHWKKNDQKHQPQPHKRSKNINKCFKREKKPHYSKTLEEIGRYWKKYNNQNPKQSQKIPLKVGEIQYFIAKFHLMTSQLANKSFSQKLDFLEKVIKDSQSPLDEITPGDLADTLHKLKAKKACGPDSL